MKLIITCLLICWTGLVFAQNAPIPTLHTSSDSLIMYLDGQKDEFNGVNKIGSQFNYSFVVTTDSSVFALVSKSDSISLILRPKINTIFKIARESKGDTVTCIFTTQKYVKPATFSDKYKTDNNGKNTIEIPEVYELINIIIALTEYGKTGVINKETEYYKKVIDHFTPYNNDAAVSTVDSLLKIAPAFYYYHLKLDSYAFVFSGDKIINGGVYNRPGGGERNELENYIPALQAFAMKSGFREFYKSQLNYYSELKRDYTDNINIVGMKSWLGKHFPTTSYSATKVIFSPLVGWNQSANFFNDNGFKEAHAHVNFPFVNQDDKKLPADILKGQRLKIAFTEINHGYINPEAEKYRKLIDSVFKDLSKWTTTGKPSSTYITPLTCFEEYMNWGLVTLYYSDIFDKKAFNTLNTGTEKTMVELRGFQRFKEFNQQLLRLYQNRKSGQTVADLYPAILEWAAK
ncbi:DUF4932 domain-containing protein [Dyadobacter sp. LJ53]|uniref:DUF4932 domain-containing protein n=1 Tax=Dyadobacter chenwenxiniae TaxID=2906456 RepID=UPI001F2E1413|nr:DUF4932 domain-containing protein [Dyadobacter chenwenxiniae]MCF0049246.1 DUF4932 domain-containing protein [Dyadobacter chenwenxiniae]